MAAPTREQIIKSKKKYFPSYEEIEDPGIFTKIMKYIFGKEPKKKERPERKPSRRYEAKKPLSMTRGPKAVTPTPVSDRFILTQAQRKYLEVLRRIDITLADKQYAIWSKEHERLTKKGEAVRKEYKGL